MIKSLVSSKEAKKAGIKIKTALDLGCGDGYFVDSLRENGIEAYGIDLAPRRKNKYLITGDAQHLDKHFKNKKFDVITANGFFCIGGQIEALTLDNKINRKRIEKDFEKFAETAYQNSLRILKGCYEQLNSPGFLICQETELLDKLIYSKKDAKNAGFGISGFNEHCATLHKVNA